MGQCPPPCIYYPKVMEPFGGVFRCPILARCARVLSFSGLDHSFFGLGGVFLKHRLVFYSVHTTAHLTFSFRQSAGLLIFEDPQTLGV